MKDMKSNKKILITVAFLGLLVLSYFGYQKYQENAKNADLANFAKTHNQKLEKANKAKAETSIPKEKENKDEKNPETSTQKSGSVKVAKKAQSEEIKERELTGKELEDYNKSFEPAPRKIVPYTEPLPEMPDEEENNSTLFGVDSNYNGVRDDLEILVVKEFGYDRDIIEAVFAGLRSNDRDLFFAKNDSIEENRQEILNNTSYKVDCYIRLTGDYGQSKSWKIIEKSSYNTAERKLLNEKVNNEVHGVMGVVATEEPCNEFYERTKSWNIRQIEGGR